MYSFWWICSWRNRPWDNERYGIMKTFFTNLTAMLIAIGIYFVVMWVGGMLFGPLFGWLASSQTDQVAYLKTMSGGMFALWLYQYGLTKLFTFLIRFSLDNATKK
jgi:hypothetical protein